MNADTKGEVVLRALSKILVLQACGAAIAAIAASGVSAHVLGVGRAFQISEAAGTFASIGMVLNALATVTLVAVLQGSL